MCLASESSNVAGAELHKRLGTMKVILIATGGTIASVAQTGGEKTAELRGEDLLKSIKLSFGVEVEVVNLGVRNSYDLGFAAMDRIVEQVSRALDRPDVDGVVVTHGTDTLEETAMLSDLRHNDRRPVVFTGAQRSADDPAPDGPRNLSDAITAACAPATRGLGVLVCFDGVLHSARGTRKIHTSALSAFFDGDNGPVGIVVARNAARVHTRLRLAESVLSSGAALAQTRVDTIALYPGADSVAIDACISAGARGVILQATGYGNANASIVEAVRRHTAAGVRVVLSTRVQGGPVRPVYGGGGGGVDLVAAGAIPSPHLRPSQARILLAALIADDASVETIAREFEISHQRYVDDADSIAPTY